MQTHIDKHWQRQPIRQAMILAAGKGTRMRPLTFTTPKPLIKVGGRALIEWHILALRQAGITDIVINAAWLADKLQAGIGDGSRYGVNIRWSVEEKPLETAGGIAKALYENQLKPEPFLLINGDVWTRHPLDGLGKNAGLNHSQAVDDVAVLAHLLLVDNPKHNRAGDFIYHDGKVLMKPEHQKLEPQADNNSSEQAREQKTWTFAGISLLHPALFVDVPYDRPYPLAKVLKQAMMTSQVSAEIYDGIWVDVGTPERLAWVNNHLKQSGFKQSNL